MKHLNKSETKQKHRTLNKLSFEAIGTLWQIQYTSTGVNNYELKKSIIKRIDRFDKTYSRFRSDSLVSEASQKAGTYTFPSDSKKLFEFYQQLYSATSGLVSPLVGKTLVDAGYDAEYSLRFNRKTISPSIDTVNFQSNTITAKVPVILDFGGAGKGYLVDIVCELMQSHGVSEGMIDAGGDIRVFSKSSKIVDVALQHPESRELAIGIAGLNNQSVCGSSIHMRNWGIRHHIINPKTGESPTHTNAVWVTAETCMVADGLATALFFVQPALLQQKFLFEYAIIKHDYSIEYSAGFPATFFDED